MGAVGEGGTGQRAAVRGLSNAAWRRRAHRGWRAANLHGSLVCGWNVTHCGAVQGGVGSWAAGAKKQKGLLAEPLIGSSGAAPRSPLSPFGRTGYCTLQSCRCLGGRGEPRGLNAAATEAS
jgi:hypothetical protein